MPAQMGDVCFTPDTGSDGPHRRCGHSIVKRKKLRLTDSGTFSERVGAIPGWLSSTLLALARKLRRRSPKGGTRSLRNDRIVVGESGRTRGLLRQLGQ